MGGKGCRPRRLPEPLIEDVHHRSTGKPVVEIAQHDEQCVSDGIEILENLPHLKPPLAHPQAEMRGQDVHERAPISTVAASAPRGSRFSIERSMR